MSMVIINAGGLHSCWSKSPFMSREVSLPAKTYNKYRIPIFHRGIFVQFLRKLRLTIMPGKSPVILILGAGPNIGQSVAQTFASKGYKVALAARSVKEADSTTNQLNIRSDFANSDDVVNAFTKVKKALGVPSVVVYNGKSHFSNGRNPMLTDDLQPARRHSPLPTIHSPYRWQT